jgi:hypothetical protein
MQKKMKEMHLSVWVGVSVSYFGASLIVAAIAAIRSGLARIAWVSACDRFAKDLGGRLADWLDGQSEGRWLLPREG